MWGDGVNILYPYVYIHINTLRYEPNDQRFAESILKCIMHFTLVVSFIESLLEFIHKDATDNESVLVQMNGLAPNRWQAITRNKGPVHWWIYVPPGPKELMAADNSVTIFTNESKYPEYVMVNASPLC